MKNHPKASAEILQLLAMNLKRLRTARGYSQVNLARRTRLRNTYISKMEHARANPTLANLERLALALECSLEALFAD